MKGLTLYSYIEQLQGDAPFGRVLDAGTGARSLRWLLTLDTDSITAITGAPAGAAEVHRLLGEWERPADRLIVGNWGDPDLVSGEQFDTVVADYLLGAVELFAPFFQTRLFSRLRALTLKRLYVTGMEPYVVQRPENPAGALIWEIGRFRDACLTLSGSQQYREFPLKWVMTELQRSGFKPIATRNFPLNYKADFVNSQIGLGHRAAERLADRPLAKALVAHGDALRERALDHVASHGSLSHGRAYVIAADPA